MPALQALDALGSTLITRRPGGSLALVESNSKLQTNQAIGDPTTVGDYQKMVAADTTIAAGWRATTFVLQGLQADITAHEDADEKVVEWARMCFFEMPKKRFEKYAQSLWLALRDGVAPHEITIKLENGIAYLADLQYRPLRTIKLSSIILDEDGWVTCEQQYRGKDGLTKIAKYAPPMTDAGAGWMLWPIYGDETSPVGLPVLRPMWFIWRQKIKALLDMAIGVERNLVGNPYVKAREKAEVKEEQKTDTLNQLERMRTNERGAMYYPAWVEEHGFEQTSGGEIDKIISVLTYYDNSILQAFGAQWMAMGLGQNTSTRSLGEIATGKQDDVGVAYFDWLANAFQPLINFLVDYNFGPQKYYPSIRCTRTNELTVEQLVDLMARMMSARLLKYDKQLEIFLREKLKVPEIEEETRDEPAEAEEAGTPPTPGVVPPQLKDTMIPPNGEEKAEDEEEEPAKMTAFADAGVRLPPKPGGQDQRTGPGGRPLSPLERLVPWQKIEMTLDTGESNLAALYVDIRRKMAQDMLDNAKGWTTNQELARALVDTQVSPGLIADSRDMIIAALQVVAEAGAETVQSEYDAQNPIESFADEIKDYGINADYLGIVADQQLKKAEQQVSMQIVQMALHTIAPSPETLRKIMEGAVREVATRDALEDATVAASDTFARARNDYVNMLVKQVGEAPQKVWYSAVLDGSTCDACRMADEAHSEGNEPIIFGSDEHKEFMPPYQGCAGGTRCRCMLIYDWE